MRVIKIDCFSLERSPEASRFVAGFLYFDLFHSGAIQINLHFVIREQEWKRMAVFWKFSESQIRAIEHQYTGQFSFREHGYRMLLIWLDGKCRLCRYSIYENCIISVLLIHFLLSLTPLPAPPLLLRPYRSAPISYPG